MAQCTHEIVATGTARRFTAKIHVATPLLSVFRMARGRMRPEQRRGGDAQLRAERHGFYRAIAEEHRDNRELYTAVMKRGI